MQPSKAIQKGHCKMDYCKKNFTRDGVIHFSTSDNRGAFTAAYRIHQSILRLGFESKLFVQKKTKNDESVVEVGVKPNRVSASRIFNKIRATRKKQDINYSYYDRMNYTLTDSMEIIKNLDFRPKIIFIHWISGFLDTDVVVNLHREFGSSVYLTFMDTAPLTGGCHYSWDCLGYQEDCRNCPAVGFLGKDLPVKNLRKKIDFVNAVSAMPVSSNTWMNKKIRASRLLSGAQIKAFNLGIDSDVFCPGSKAEARDRLGIPVNKKYILVAASSLNDPRKGIQYAKRAISHLVEKSICKLEDVEILLAGSPGKFGGPYEWALPSRWVGVIKGDQALVDLYRAADIFLSPSIEDAGPMMISEAMLCGTPVASFDVGFACDLINYSKSGFVVPAKDHAALAQSLRYFLSLDSISVETIAHHARQSAIDRVSLHAEEKNLLSLLNGCI